MSVKIGHAVYDENGKTVGGTAGDQTGNEITIRTWYRKPWIKVLRPTYDTDKEIIANTMIAACANNHIGYNSEYENKDEFHTMAKSVKFDLSKIEKDCGTDDTGIVITCLEAARILVPFYYNIDELMNALSHNKKFVSYTSDEFISESTKLQRGDILFSLNHVAIVVETDNDKKKFDKPIGKVLTHHSQRVYSSANTKRLVPSEMTNINIEYPVVQVIDFNWYKIIMNDNYRYIEHVPENAVYVPNKNSIQVQHLILTEDSVLRQYPQEESKIVKKLKKGTKIIVVKQVSNYGLILSGEGWIDLSVTKQ